ncbi:MAG: DUF202 domain-containing protein [Candidatus Erginobacter occultus]|nr:DUF202 domain-containing protein [Candidatus Erginobacter occultus]
MKNNIPARLFCLERVTDHLAADRTILANERTLLSYLRFSFGLFVAGISFHKFFDDSIIRVLGIAFLPLAALVAAIGIRRYRRCQRYLITLKEGKDETLPAPPRGTAPGVEGSGAEPDLPGGA